MLSDVMTRRARELVSTLHSSMVRCMLNVATKTALRVVLDLVPSTRR